MSKIAALALLVAIAAPGIALAAPGDDEDRYGPPPAPFVDPAAPDSVQPTLSWPGKLAATPRPSERRPAPQAYAAPTPTAYVAAAGSASLPLPTSIHASPPSPLTPPAVAAPPAASADSGQPPRFYSVHREFGLAPDPAPAPLPTQFFAASADLAEPPPPPPPHVLPAGQQAMTASARARADAGDPDAAPATLDNSAP